MRKTLFLLTTLLSGSLAFAQEAEHSEGNDIEVRVIPRFDANPYIPFSKRAGSDFDFGSTSLYTQIEGNIGSRLTYFFSNHWLSTHPGELYTIDGDGKNSANLFRSDYTNWLDMGYIGLNFGSWDFTLGKDMITIGSFEEDAYDYESHPNMNSYFWNMAQVYQWGAKAAWTSPDETSQFLLQIMSSPFSEHPFGKSWYGEGGHLKTISAGWYGEYENYRSIWAVNMMEYSKGKYLGIIGLGNRFYSGDFTFTLDLQARVNSMKKFFAQENSVSGTVQYAAGDKAELFAKAGFDSARRHDFFAAPDSSFVPGALYEDGNRFTDHGNCFYGGIGLHYYPIKGSRDLRLHAVAAMNTFSKDQLSLSIGALYSFDLSGAKRRKKEKRTPAELKAI